MSIEIIRKAITEKLANVDAREKTLVVNGKYFLYKQKSVYVELSELKQIEFFIRVKKLDENDNPTDIVEKQYVTDTILHKLFTIITSNTLGNFECSCTVPVNKYNIMVDSSLDFLLIEGSLYNIARKAIMSGVARQELHLSDFHLSAAELRSLMSAFKQLSYDNYNKFIFNKSHRRIINRCYKKKQFFNILHAFIPVAISYSFVYNPLLDDKNDNTFLQSKLMQTAIKKNRKIEVNDNLYCYMLTHKEICEALGLSRFMRFTPDFLYKFVVGALHPELANFPTKTTKIYVKPVDIDGAAKLNNSYSETEFTDVVASLATKLENTVDEAEQDTIKTELAALEYYKNVDTLYYEIERDRRALISIGATHAEHGITADVLYDILAEGSLMLGGDI